MSNPDSKSNMNSLSIAIPAGIFIFILTIILFEFKNSISNFSLLLWIGFPIIGFIIASSINFGSQYMTCKHVNSKKAFLGAIPTFIAIIIGLGISSISWCRIPVVSVITPLFIDKAVDITNKSNGLNSIKNINSKECCLPKLSLERIESNFPIISGFSYGFYLLFSMLFGTIIGTGVSSIC
jgi:hypothetical protein